MVFLNFWNIIYIVQTHLPITAKNNHMAPTAFTYRPRDTLDIFRQNCLQLILSKPNSVDINYLENI